MSQEILYSPDRSLSVTIAFEGSSLSWSVVKNGVPVLLPSPLGFDLAEVDASKELVFAGKEEGEINETYTIPAFKKAECLNYCKTLKLCFTKDGYPFSVEARAFDNGAAVRLNLEKEGTFKKELTGFRLPENTHTVYCTKFRFSYEDEYNPVPLEDLFQNFWNFPVLTEQDQGVWGLLAEAAVFGDYGGSILSSTKEAPTLLSITAPPDEFSPLPLPVSTPWRVIVAGSLDDVANGNVLENLNPPCELTDTSFIKPGMVAWSWMTEQRSPRDFNRQKDFIDFAAKMNWPYILDDGGWREAGVDIPALVAYGKEKGVGVWIWEHRKYLQDPEIADKTLKEWASWGIAGVKIDFFESDTRERISAMDMLARTTAKYGLMVNFHGCTKPAGEIRRWPNIMTREGVMGAENFQNYSTEYWVMPTARHNCTLPFTRNAVGPMDYTPVNYRTYRTGTTDTHQTALPLIFTSYVTHVGESPDPVLTNPCGEFLKGLPTTWDESKLLEGNPGSYVTMARRKGDDWYIAGITATRGRTAQLDLSFLAPGEYEATLYKDSLEDLRYVDVPIGAKEPTTKKQYDEWEKGFSRLTSHQHDLTLSEKSVFTVKAGNFLEVPEVQDGGFVMKLVLKK